MWSGGPQDALGEIWVIFETVNPLPNAGRWRGIYTISDRAGWKPSSVPAAPPSLADSTH